jgi:hypothetical protein
MIPNHDHAIENLADALAENDDTDPDYGSPESWPLWTDRDRLALGPASFGEKSLFDASGTSDCPPLPAYEPTPEDFRELDLWLTRLETSRWERWLGNERNPE